MAYFCQIWRGSTTLDNNFLMEACDQLLLNVWFRAHLHMHLRKIEEYQSFLSNAEILFQNLKIHM